MSKDEAIAANVSVDQKESLENEAGEDAVNEPRAPSAVFKGVPTNFRASCVEARRGNTNGYYWVGRNFTAQLESNIPYDLSFDEWDDCIRDLQRMISNGDDRGIWSWLRAFFPRCMQFVPSRRRDQFLKGLYDYAEEEGWIFQTF